MASHITPTDLIRLAPFSAVPAAEIPGDDPGLWSTVIAVQTGNGSLAVGGFPIDALDLQVLCTTGGEIGTAAFSASRDAGVVFLPPVVSEANPDLGGIWRYQIPLTGITAELRFATAPSFVQGDLFTFATTASQRLLDLIAAGSALWDQHARNQYVDPENHTPSALEKLYIAQIVRWWLFSGRGLPDADARQQERMFDIAYKHFQMHSKGDLRAAPGEQTEAPFFPDVMYPRRPRLPAWRH